MSYIKTNIKWSNDSKHHITTRLLKSISKPILYWSLCCINFVPNETCNHPPISPFLVQPDSRPKALIVGNNLHAAVPGADPVFCLIVGFANWWLSLSVFFAFGPKPAKRYMLLWQLLVCMTELYMLSLFKQKHQRSGAASSTTLREVRPSVYGKRSQQIR